MGLLSSLSECLFCNPCVVTNIHFALRKCQEGGIWAWDCLENEPVLLIPMVLALLGDNPMQSEFACHIGLKGKLFCRACWVKGTDARAEAEPQPPGSPHASAHGSEADTASSHGSAAASEASEGNSDGQTTKGRRKKVLESMSNMVDRVKAFVKVTHILLSVFRRAIYGLLPDWAPSSQRRDHCSAQINV